MASQLRKASCIVHVADHGADALNFLKKSTFARDSGPSATPLSIVLMDLEMPVGIDSDVKWKQMLTTSGNGWLDVCETHPGVAKRWEFYEASSCYCCDGKCKVRTGQECEGSRDGEFTLFPPRSGRQ
jgi:hypothetical protein